MTERPKSSPTTRIVAALVGVVVGLLIVALVTRARKQPPVVRPSPTPSVSVTTTPSAAPISDASAEASTPYIELDAGTLSELNQALVSNIAAVHGLTEAQTEKVRAVFEGSRWIGQGNPEITRHPMTRAECREIRSHAEIVPGSASCGLPYMVPVYDPSRGETEEQAKVCIDQYEFPDIPCEYPVVYARANEASDLCEAMGKRLCDAHEWEGACAGALKSPEDEYVFGKDHPNMEYAHNEHREMIWAYGSIKDQTKCATGSRKSPKCFGGGWNECGSNTYPAGAFPECKSRFGVYDQHGNAAEHMNLPLGPDQFTSRGGYGGTEMKGSWFIFQAEEVHPDDCRWRALAWHETKLKDPNSHRNYHLGFRCCKNQAR